VNTKKNLLIIFYLFDDILFFTRLKHLDFVGNQRSIDLKTEEIDAEARKEETGRVAEKQIKLGKKRNCSIGLGEVPAPQFIHLIHNYKFNFNNLLTERMGTKSFSLKLSYFSI